MTTSNQSYPNIPGSVVYRIPGTTDAPNGESFDNGFISLVVDDSDEEDFHGKAWTNFYTKDGEPICSVERMTLKEADEWIKWAEINPELQRVK